MKNVFEYLVSMIFAILLIIVFYTLFSQDAGPEDSQHIRAGSISTDFRTDERGEMKLKELLGQIVRVKDRRVVGKKHSALLLAVSRDGSIGYLRLTQNGSKIQARDYEIMRIAFGS